MWGKHDACCCNLESQAQAAASLPRTQAAYKQPAANCQQTTNTTPHKLRRACMSPERGPRCSCSCVGLLWHVMHQCSCVCGPYQVQRSGATLDPAQPWIMLNFIVNFMVPTRHTSSLVLDGAHTQRTNRPIHLSTALVVACIHSAAYTGYSLVRLNAVRAWPLVSVP